MAKQQTRKLHFSLSTILFSLNAEPKLSEFLPRCRSASENWIQLLLHNFNDKFKVIKKVFCTKTFSISVFFLTQRLKFVFSHDFLLFCLQGVWVLFSFRFHFFQFNLKRTNITTCLLTHAVYSELLETISRLLFKKPVININHSPIEMLINFLWRTPNVVLHIPKMCNVENLSFWHKKLE